MLYPHDMATQVGPHYEQMRSGITIGSSKFTLKTLSPFVQLQLEVVKRSKFIK